MGLQAFGLPAVQAVIGAPPPPLPGPRRAGKPARNSSACLWSPSSCAPLMPQAAHERAALLDHSHIAVLAPPARPPARRAQVGGLCAAHAAGRAGGVWRLAGRLLRLHRALPGGQGCGAPQRGRTPVSLHFTTLTSTEPERGSWACACSLRRGRPPARALAHASPRSASQPSRPPPPARPGRARGRQPGAAAGHQARRRHRRRRTGGAGGHGAVCGAPAGRGLAHLAGQGADGRGGGRAGRGRPAPGQRAARVVGLTASTPCLPPAPALPLAGARGGHPGGLRQGLAQPVERAGRRDLRPAGARPRLAASACLPPAGHLERAGHRHVPRARAVGVQPPVAPPRPRLHIPPPRRSWPSRACT